MWTQVRLLLEEQSDLGPHCLLPRHFKWSNRRFLVAFSSRRVRHQYIKFLIPHSLQGQAIVVDIQANSVDPDQTAPIRAV